jgi:hypothetical protein
MPHYVVDKVGEALNHRRKSINGSKVLVAGVAYKRDIDDMRESPAMDVMGLLAARGAVVSYADPFVPDVRGREWPGGRDLKTVDMTRGNIARRLRGHRTDHGVLAPSPAGRSGPDRRYPQRHQAQHPNVFKPARRTRREGHKSQSPERGCLPR